MCVRLLAIYLPTNRLRAVNAPWFNKCSTCVVSRVSLWVMIKSAAAEELYWTLFLLRNSLSCHCVWVPDPSGSVCTRNKTTCSKQPYNGSVNKVIAVEWNNGNSKHVKTRICFKQFNPKWKCMCISDHIYSKWLGLLYLWLDLTWNHVRPAGLCWIQWNVGQVTTTQMFYTETDGINSREKRERMFVLGSNSGWKHSLLLTPFLLTLARSPSFLSPNFLSPTLFLSHIWRVSAVVVWLLVG